MKNNTFKEIADALDKAHSVVIFPHILMDGDAMGSAAALCRALRLKGKEAVILVEDKIPDYLMFLDNGYCTYDQEACMGADICLCIDCGELKRFPERKEVFQSGKKKICVDHHPTSPGIGDLNHIDGSAAATGELVFDLLQEMHVEPDREISNGIFAAITTDTGNFQYSNTTKRSHEIIMALYDQGLDAYATSVALYENESLAKITLMSKVMSDCEIIADGKAIVATVSQHLLEETGARMEDTEGIVGTMRSIKGVDIAVLIKEKEKENIKVSLRAKEGNVANIALRFGGGGHEKAAGCTIKKDLSSAREMVVKEVMESICKG